MQIHYTKTIYNGWIEVCYLQVAMLGKNLSHLTSGGGEDGEQIKIFISNIGYFSSIFGEQIKIFAYNISKFVLKYLVSCFNSKYLLGISTYFLMVFEPNLFFNISYILQVRTSMCLEVLSGSFVLRRRAEW